jgi:insertion element IS1 protein InsB
MSLLGTSCFKSVGGRFCCNYCCGLLIKNGKSKSGNQRYICKDCCKTQVANYFNNAYLPTINQNIVMLTKEGLGIRSTARVLQISTTTLLKRIISIADGIKLPIISIGKSYEVDELRTFIKRKTRLIWIVYALERNTKQVVSFNIGARTNKTLNVVIETLKLAKATKIYTDGLRNYKYLIDHKVHIVKQFATNHIERKNLTM